MGLSSHADSRTSGDARSSNAAFDAVTGSIVRRLITNAVKEMGITLMRSTRSPVMFEAKDFATGIFDAQGRVLEYHQYLPLMAFCLGPAVREVIRRWHQELAPGDVFIHNDTYRGGTHAMDVALIRPVFEGDQLVGWSACKGHMMDWGGPVPSGYNSRARSTWDEPLRVPAVRLYRAGKRCEETFELLGANIRIPEIMLHDVQAMAGCTGIGAQRLLDVIDRFGLSTFESLASAWVSRTRDLVNGHVLDIPDGVYEGHSRVQYRQGSWAEIALSVIISNEKITVDFTGTSAQTDSFVNAPLSVTRGAVLHCVAMILGPSVDFNAGFEDAVEVKVPPRTILSAEYPAAVGYCLHLSDQVSEAFFKALAPVIPDKVIAGWLQWGTTVAGTWQDQPFTTPLFFPSKGGSGAMYGADGYDYIGSIRMAGALESEDIEVFERTHEWMEIRRLEYWSDSGGPGRWRGGLGSYSEMLLLGDDMELAVFGTGRDEGAYGLFDGHHSPRSRLLVEYPDSTTEDVPAMANVRGVPTGTVLKKWNTGGGGVGDPKDRDHALIERDVIEGYVSRQVADEVYGRSRNEER